MRHGQVNASPLHTGLIAAWPLGSPSLPVSTELPSLIATCSLHAGSWDQLPLLHPHQSEHQVVLMSLVTNHPSRCFSSHSSHPNSPSGPPSPSLPQPPAFACSWSFLHVLPWARCCVAFCMPAVYSHFHMASAPPSHSFII